VHEHVQAGEDAGQLLAAVLAQEDRGRHQPPQPVLGRPAAHHDQAHPGQRGHPGQQLNLLLRG
jgi:hypothetical protein